MLLVESLLLATLLAAGAPADAPAAEATAAAPPEWKAFGWSLDDGTSPDDACPFTTPSLDPAMAVWTVGHAPDQVPRPSVKCSDQEIVLPIPPTDGFLVRREGEKPSVEWDLKIDARRQGTARVLRVDLPPAASDPDPKSAQMRIGGRMPNGALAIEPVPMRMPYREPNRRMFPNAISPQEPAGEPRVATLVATPLAQIEHDGLVATPDDGRHWFGLDLGGELPRLHHMLRAGNIFGSGGALYVVPRSLHPRAVTHVFRVDPATSAIADLGNPAPVGAPWSVRVTDLRERAGHLEILLAADTATTDQRNKTVWGMHARREGDGWVELSRFFVPELDETLLPTLRFDAEHPDNALFLSEHLRLSRPLKLPPS